MTITNSSPGSSGSGTTASTQPTTNALPWASEDVLGKGTGEGLLAADLLAAHEALDRDGNSPVDVLLRTVLGQSHTAECLTNADDGFEMSNLIQGVSILEEMPLQPATWERHLDQLTVIG